MLCRDLSDAPLAGDTAAGGGAWSGASQAGGIQPRAGSEQLAASFRELAVASITKRLHASLTAGMEPSRSSSTNRLAQVEAELLKRSMTMQREVGGPMWLLLDARTSCASSELPSPHPPHHPPTTPHPPPTPAAHPTPPGCLASIRPVGAGRRLPEAGSLSS